MNVLLCFRERLMICQLSRPFLRTRYSVTTEKQNAREKKLLILLAIQLGRCNWAAATHQGVTKIQREYQKNKYIT